MTGDLLDRERHRRWLNVRRVLLVRLDNLGDVLMSTPAFAAVRETLPWAHLTLLAAPGSEPLRPHLAMIDEMIGFHASWMKTGASVLDTEPPEMRGEAERHLVRRLGRARFDAAILFTVCTQSALPAALICRMAGIPLVLAHVRERAYGLLSDELPDPDIVQTGMRHEVQRQLDLVAHVGLFTKDDRLRFRVLPRDQQAAQRALAAAGLQDGQPYAVVHPGASAPSRRYAPTAFAAAADRMRQDPGAEGTAIVWCAGAHEQALVDEARAAMRESSLVLPRPPTLGELAALIAGARVLVANNSGPVHLAAAVGTPVVDLYALTNPQHTPWRVPARVLNHDVPCRNCQRSVCVQGHHDCLRLVDPADVARAASSLMRETVT
ncbi:glycosyltransferase family 9 protein [Roseateles depolymerans]|uniref:Glycosyl transferase family 9 n=1 Tax=Roseateles depolymerans TaxID=76731 RepID=A0A0U3MCZ2_9BURK|nr:glycosyltransferase family 9 protein [Roseateles depolymerans]ALV06509.1 Glycosyl transferase family 9 [Roseateles depolymerans]REG19484.1 lipopolysaccharide heptosyltransferase II [Roseateles depolymerans]